jgi:hypothetical protein
VALFLSSVREDAVPDATTLIKLNQRFGEDRVRGLNKSLIKELLKARSIKPRRIRIDSTTLEAHISYPEHVGVIWNLPAGL